jgi:hypothetical protein
MSTVKAILKNHFEYKEKRGWDKTYWFFDIHGTIDDVRITKNTENIKSKNCIGWELKKNK